MARRLVVLTILVSTLTLGMAAAAWWSLRPPDESAATLPSLPEGGAAGVVAGETTTMPLTLIAVDATAPLDTAGIIDPLVPAAPGAAPAAGGTGSPAPAATSSGGPATSPTSPATNPATNPATTAAPTTAAPATTRPPATTTTTAPSTQTTLPPGAKIPSDWPPGKPIPPVPPGCKEPVLEDNGVWNCQH